METDPPPPPPAPAVVSPEQAAKVLAADTKNAIRGVSEGGTLQAPHRRQMQAIAVTPQAAREARIAALVARWMAGHDLSAEQRAEIVVAHPGFTFDVPPAASSESSLLDADPPASETTLPTVEPAGQATAAQIAEAAIAYGTKRRALFRWLALGKAKNDPCPLNAPEKMPAWWNRNRKHAIPDKIAAAAAKVTKVVVPENPLSASGAGDAGTIAPFAGPSLASAEMIEGEAVKQARQIVGMCFEQLRGALESRPPDLEKAALWQVRWEKSQEALRKQERDEREARKQDGDLLPRGAVLTEIAQLIEALRLAHMSMGRKILAELGRNAAGRNRRVLTLIEPAILAAVEAVRGKETDLFAHIDTLTSPALAAESLAA